MADSPRIEELKRRVQSDPASIAFAALAEEYRRAGRFEEAIDTCTAGLVRHPSYLSAHVTLGRALIDVGRLEEAKKELESVLRLAPENLAAIRGLAEIHERLRDEPRDHHRAVQIAGVEPPHHEMTVEEIQAASGFKPPEPDEAVHTPETPASPVDAPPVPSLPSVAEPEPAFSVSPIATEEHVPAEMPPLAAPPAHIRQPSTDTAALAGLEEFLDAIRRARAERPAAR
jgi:tetratricopeptide (TPR) repeat protein